jgi:hypothetical protein
VEKKSAYLKVEGRGIWVLPVILSALVRKMDIITKGATTKIFKIKTRNTKSTLSLS